MAVKVTFVRSGGLAGRDMVAAVDSVDLPKDQQDVIASLFAEDLRGPGVSRPGAADQFTCRLEMHQGGRTVKRQWKEPEVHEMVRPLLTALARQAKPVR